MPAFGVFYQRMYPTLSPKPANVKEAFLVVQKMWGALTETEKEVRPVVPIHRKRPKVSIASAHFSYPSHRDLHPLLLSPHL